MGDGHGRINKVASSWTLHGWSPSWTWQSLTFVGSSLHQRGRTIAQPIGTMPKIFMSPLRLPSPNPSLYLHMQCLLSAAILLELHV